jgi:ankyrin repeat protein
LLRLGLATPGSLRGRDFPSDRNPRRPGQQALAVVPPYNRRMSDLSEAIKAGDGARVTALLDADPALAGSPEQGVTPVLLAIYHGELEVARLIAARLDKLPFPEAVALGESETVRSMLAADRSLLEQRSSDGFPPLGLAIFFRHGELARWLIDHGADVNAAAENGQKVAPLHAAAAVQDVETAALLLAKGADARAKQQMGYTPLHGAASRGNVPMGKLLLAHGAELDAVAEDGLTPAASAEKYGHPEWAAAVRS